MVGGAQLSDGGESFEGAVRRVLSSTTAGDVLTYGEVAAEAGYPGAARAVGNLLRNSDGLPWWRVVSAQGRLVPHHADEHAQRLEAEGHTIARGAGRATPRLVAGHSTRAGRADPGSGSGDLAISG